MRTERAQSADGIGPSPREGPPIFRSERFRQHKTTVKPIDQRQNSSRYKRSAQRIDAENAVLTEQPSQRRSGNEADAKRGADDAKIGRALLRRAYIGDISHRRRIIRARDASQNTSHKKPA